MGKLVILVLLLLIRAPALAQSLFDLPQVIEEGNTVRISLLFSDSNGTPVMPSQVNIYVDHMESTLRLYESGNLTPAGPSLTHIIPPQANRVIEEANSGETHIITVAWKYPSGCTVLTCRQGQKQFRYRVANNPRVFVAPGPTVTPAGTIIYGVTPFPYLTPTP